MTWKTKAIKELAISDGLAVSLGEKLKVKQCAELAEAFTTESGLAIIKGFGTGAYDVIVRELMTVSRGEFEEMLPKPAEANPDVVKFPDPLAGSTVTPPVEEKIPEKVEESKPEVVAAKPEKEGKTKKKAESKELTPVAKSDAEHAKLIALRHSADKILKQRSKVLAADSEFDEQKEVLKSKKKAKERERDVLIEMLEELVDDQQRLPGMSSLKDEKPTIPAEAATNEPPAESLKSISGTPEDKPDWRKESVTVLISPGLGRATITKLIDANIRTMEDLHYAFLANKVYTIEGLNRDKADKLREVAFEWLGKNREKKDADPKTEIRLVKDLLDPSGAVICESGAVLPIAISGTMIGCVFNGVAHALTSDQWEPLSRPKMIQIVQPVPGADNDTDKMLPGLEVEVLRWHGNSAVVKSPHSQREIIVAQAEFEAL